MEKVNKRRHQVYLTCVLFSPGSLLGPGKCNASVLMSGNISSVVSIVVSQTPQTHGLSNFFLWEVSHWN